MCACVYHLLTLLQYAWWHLVESSWQLGWRRPPVSVVMPATATYYVSIKRGAQALVTPCVSVYLVVSMWSAVPFFLCDA